MNSPAYNVQMAANQALLSDTAQNGTGVVGGEAPLGPLIEAHPWVGAVIMVFVMALVAVVVLGPAVDKVIRLLRRGR